MPVADKHTGKLYRQIIMQIFSPFRFFAVTALLSLTALFFSCAGAPKTVPGPEDEPSVPIEVPEPSPPGPEDGIPEDEARAPEDAPKPPVPPVSLPEKPSPKPPLPVLPPENIPIMGKGLSDHEELSAFLLSNNPGIDMSFAEELSALYREESAVEGINHDVAFAQMCLETGFLRYGGLVTPEMNNFCGLGAISADSPGESFSSPQIGVRAHIQHLKAYASTEGLNQELVDPRHFWVRYGSAPTVDNLTGSWATDQEYGIKLRKILSRLYQVNKASQQLEAVSEFQNGPTGIAETDNGVKTLSRKSLGGRDYY
jgi:hypothetical protein